VEKKHPQKFTAKIPTSGKYYIVAEKMDKIYGGLREIAVSPPLSLHLSLPSPSLFIPLPKEVI
jgi:hypothetical protein